MEPLGKYHYNGESESLCTYLLMQFGPSTHYFRSWTLCLMHGILSWSTHNGTALEDSGSLAQKHASKSNHDETVDLGPKRSHKLSKGSYKTVFLLSPLYRALEPGCEILVFIFDHTILDYNITYHTIPCNANNNIPDL